MKERDSLLGKSARARRWFRCCGLDQVRLFNVLVMGVGFLFLFTAYNTVQTLLTSLLTGYGSLANNSLSVLYLVVAVVVFFAPIVVPWTGERAAMWMGAFLYCVYIGSLVYIVPWVVYVCSVLIGIGAAILWVAQGAFITRCSDDDTRGRNSGLFWAIFQVSGVVGNLAAYFILQNETNVAWLFAIFLVVGVAGVVILLFLQEVPGLAPPSLPKSLLELLLESLRMMVFDKDMLLLLPVMFFTGFELSFYSGTFPKLIIPTKDVGLVMTSFGAAEVICGLLVGKLSDHVSRKIIVIFACVAYTGALVLSWLLLQHPTQQLFAYGAAVCVGIGDSTFNTQIYATLGTLYPGSDAVPAFTIFQFVQNVGSAVGFFYEPLLPLGLGTSGSLIQLYIVFGVGVLGTLLYLFVNLTPREQRMREI